MTPGGLPDLRPKASALPPLSPPAPPATRREARMMPEPVYLYEDAPIDELDLEAGDFLASFLFAEGADGDWSIRDVYLFNVGDDAETLTAIAQQIKLSHSDGAPYADHLTALVDVTPFEARMFEIAPIESVSGSEFLASFTFTRDFEGWAAEGAYLFNVADTGNALETIAREIGNIDWRTSRPQD